MTIHIEVCVDNITSLTNAVNAGADRIELCSALALGGLTPGPGLVKQALALSPCPIYAMIRPRAGDFVFNQHEVDIMLDDIQFMLEQGVAGVVIGALTAEGNIDTDTVRRLVQKAVTLDITFHRAFDLCNGGEHVLDQLIDLGCRRILTSGRQQTAQQGIATLHQLVNQANDRIIIMAGSGVNHSNAQQIVAQTGVSELHLSGKVRQPGAFKGQNTISMGTISMGAHSEDDYYTDITSYDKIKALVDLFHSPAASQ